jgi:hypothetical protein
MYNEEEEYENISEGLQNFDDQTEFDDFDGEDFDDFDDALSDIDFSQISGNDFKRSFKKVNSKITSKQTAGAATKRNAPVRKAANVRYSPNVRKATNVRKAANVRYAKPKPIKPLTKEFGVKKDANIFGGKKQIGKIIVPSDKKVIVEGVSKFILNNTDENDVVRNLGYYKGEKLKELILIFNNNSLLDFNLQIFNPSMPLDYLYSTSLNLNNKIQVAGGAVSYTDVLYNLLANPALLVNAKFVIAGASVPQQFQQTLQVINKRIDGVEKIVPVNVALQFDNMQVQNDMVIFDIMKNLNRPFIPDGMDVVNYTVLAGNTVTMCFYYKQISLKRVFFEEARKSKILL